MGKYLKTRIQKEKLFEAQEKLLGIGIDLTYESDSEVRFIHKGSVVSYFTYSGWFSGKSVKDGRGLNNLIKQLA